MSPPNTPPISNLFLYPPLSLGLLALFAPPVLPANTTPSRHHRAHYRGRDHVRGGNFVGVGPQDALQAASRVRLQGVRRGLYLRRVSRQRARGLRGLHGPERLDGVQVLVPGQRQGDSIFVGKYSVKEIKVCARARGAGRGRPSWVELTGWMRREEMREEKQVRGSG